MSQDNPNDTLLEELAEKDEVIRELQLQLAEQQEQISQLEGLLEELREENTEQAEGLKELMIQLEGKDSQPTTAPASSDQPLHHPDDNMALVEQENVIREQMEQILDLEEKVEELRGRLLQYEDDDS